MIAGLFTGELEPASFVATVIAAALAAWGLCWTTDKIHALRPPAPSIVDEMELERAA
jgi:hypothetical protein